MTEVKFYKSPLIYTMIATLLLCLSISYCGSLATANVVKPALDAQMNAIEIDLRLPQEMRVVKNIDEGKRGEK